MFMKHYKQNLQELFEKPFYLNEINMSKITYLDHVATLLPPEEVATFQACYLQRLPKTIKVISSKIAVDEFIKLVTDMGWKLEPTTNSDCFHVHTFTDSATLGQHFLHQG